MTRLLILLLLAGCGGGASSEMANSTPAQALYLSDRTITDGNEISNILLIWQGQREAEAKVTYNVVSIPGYTLITIDDWGFQCSYSSTGWCNGGYGEGVIEAPIYHRLKFTHKPSESELIGTARHTLISSDEIYKRTGVDIWKDLGYWYVGYIPQGEIGLGVLTHELGHLLGRHVDSGKIIHYTDAVP